MNKQECIEQCTFENGIIKLPDVELDRKVFLDVKKTLTSIGAKWKSGKTWGFVLGEDKAELFERIKNNHDYNYRQSTQFFETPTAVCDLIRDEILAIHSCAELQYLSILEPSAGCGALFNVIRQINPVVQIQYCELDSHNQKVLKNVGSGNIDFLRPDFMRLSSKWEFDLIVANPPFTRGSAQKHLLKMIAHLKPRHGVVICVMPKNWREGQWAEKFEFLEYFDCREVECPEKAFEHTNISTVIVVIKSR